uniref:Arrestin_N domain-containing protein n=1 Tax=Meloidogyne hapla TaxID=6305 RepID=A0A1I8BXF1_MELHA
MKIENFVLKLEKPQNLDENYFYLAGEEIKGKLNISTKEKTRIARLSLRTIGSTYTGWQYSNSEYESKEIILDIYNDLTENLSIYCDEAMELNCGEYNIEFTVKIPINVISSYNEENYGNVKYTIVATLDIAEDCGESEIVSGSEI